jgi:hypothetical protein
MNKMMNNLWADFGPLPPIGLAGPHDMARVACALGVIDGSRVARKAGRASASCGMADGHGGSGEISPDGQALGKGVATASMAVFPWWRRPTGS